MLILMTKLYMTVLLFCVSHYLYHVQPKPKMKENRS